MLTFTTVSSVQEIIIKNVRFLNTKTKSNTTIKKLYETLGVSEDCNDEVLRLAFVNLAKRFHPDSGNNEASASRFSEIENAYRAVQRYRFEERENHNEIEQRLKAKEFDIKHTAPQHRHYLTHNVGIGTPGMRERQYSAERAQKAIENVMEHRLKKIQASERNSLIGVDKQRAKDVKISYGMDRLVEDLIQDAMNRGEFSDLPGTGKPLKDNLCAQNPYVDFVTHKLNKILIDNGFTPEWIQLSKEIREETLAIKHKLREVRNMLGKLPLTHDEEKRWKLIIEDSIEEVKKINNKIDKYNLLVPILQKQMVQINLKYLADKILSMPPDEIIDKKSYSDPNSTKSYNSSTINFITFLSSFFSK